MAWTTPRTWVTGELVTASIMNTDERDNLAYLKTITDTLQTTAISATPTRAINGTVYQNGAKRRIVTVSYSVAVANPSSAQAIITAYSGATNTPATICGSVGLGSSAFTGGCGYNYALTFVVEPNYYYKVTEATSGTGIISSGKQSWVEWDEH